MATVINSLRDRADTLATALKNLYVKLGGSLTDKPDGTHTVSELVTIPECVDAITSIAEPGGGGSSDFSTATVTLNLTPPEGFTADFIMLNGLRVPFPIDDGESFPYTSSGALASEGKVEILLYDGVGYFGDPNSTDIGVLIVYDTTRERELTVVGSLTLSGNVETDQTYGYKVTGNCTVSATLVASA